MPRKSLVPKSRLLKIKVLLLEKMSQTEKQKSQLFKTKSQLLEIRLQSFETRLKK